MAIRIAVAGMGARGQDWVREVKVAPAFELAACVDVNAAALQPAAARLGVSADQCFNDLGKALDATGCQAVIVVKPADCHATTCETALARKLAVLVEKPFTLRFARCGAACLAG
jgi:predicted dehydrogenase